MASKKSAHMKAGALTGGAVVASEAAHRAYRRAWWSLALYPVTFAVAMVIGEGLFSLLTDDAGDAPIWAVLGSATPALLVLVIPGILSVTQGRKAMRLGRKDGKVPAIIAAGIAVWVVGINITAYVAGLVFG